MNMRYLLLFMLLINVELYSKDSKRTKTRRFEQSADQSAQNRRKQKSEFCSLTVKENLTAGQLNVCGNSCLCNLTVKGNEVVNGDVNVNGHLFVNGSEIINCANGCITTPSTSTDNAIVLFSGTTGKILKQSPAPVTIDPANNVGSANDITMTGNLNMVSTPSDLSVGVITKDNQRFIYDLGNSTSTFVGVNAGLASSLSFGNTGIGFEALGSLSNGSSNTAIGRESMHFSTTGSFNTAIGSLSLIQSNGSFNTALGYNTLQGLTGLGNVAVGSGALQNTTGGSNTAVGFGAGNALTSGSTNIYVGANVGASLGDPTESFITRIGNNGVQLACFIAGINNSTVTGNAVMIDSNGRLGLLPPSSRRYKQDITDMADSTANLINLRPITFRYKPEVDQSGALQYGLIAEEVAEVYPDLVIYNKDNQPESVKYHLLNVMLLNELSKQDKIIKDLLARIVKLEDKTVN